MLLKFLLSGLIYGSEILFCICMMELINDFSMVHILDLNNYFKIPNLNFGDVFLLSEQCLLNLTFIILT